MELTAKKLMELVLQILRDPDSPMNSVLMVGHNVEDAV